MRNREYKHKPGMVERNDLRGIALLLFVWPAIGLAMWLVALWLLL
jgi:hypothetical protein